MDSSDFGARPQSGPVARSRTNRPAGARPLPRPRGAGRLALLLLVIGSLALVPAATRVPEAAAVGPPGNEVLQIPLRWCAVQGSEAQANPSAVGEATTNDYLWRRHERATDRVFTPGANITFRSAFAASFLALSFPIIADPNPGLGQPGDILYANPPSQEMKDAWAACDAAWNALATSTGKPLVGFPAISLRRIVDGGGTPIDIRGQGQYTYSYTGSVTGSVCDPPLVGNFQWKGMIAVSDYSSIWGFDADDLLTAHELGHALGLGHGNGLDDNNNGVYDQNCDAAEDPDAGPFTVMSNGNNKRRTLTALQRETTRATALVYSGTVKDPPAALLPADTVSDQRTDAVHDVADDGVDLTAVAVAENTMTGDVIVSHALYGVIPREDVENQYVAFADLDDDPATGGEPAGLGFSTQVAGIELVTRVVVGPGHDPVPTAWVYRDGDFEELPAGEQLAAVGSVVDGETGLESANTVTIEIPPGALGPVGPRMQLQAIAEQLQAPGELDRLPSAEPDSQIPINLEPPEFPVCAVEPPVTIPGGTVRIDITGLLPNSQVHVVLGDRLVTDGQTDGAGNAEIELVLPGDTLGGPRLVTVGVDGTALTADCTVEVKGDPGENVAELRAAEGAATPAP